MPVLWSSDQLASHEFPNPAYLIEPVIPLGGIVLLYGKPGVGKTQFIMSLAQAINSGTDFLGRWPSTQGPVVIIQADMTGQIQQDRIIKVYKEINLSNTHWVIEPDGSAPYLNIQTMNIMQEDLVEAIRAVDPVLLVWDTLRKIHQLPENASESAVAVYHAARQVCPLATQLFVHHTRKESRDPDAIAHADESFMGNQQWKGSADSTISLSTLDDTIIPRRVVLEFHKARTASDIERRPIILELDMCTILLHPCSD